MDKKKKNGMLGTLLTYVLLIGVTIFMISMLNTNVTKEMSYSEFMQKINEDSVEKVEITNDRLTANVKLKNEENSVRVVNIPSTTTFMEDVGEKLNEGKFELVVLEPSFWEVVGPMIPNILLLLGTLFIFIFMLRRTTDSNSKAMSFGKNRARMIDKNSNVTVIISKGPSHVTASNSTIEWYNVKNGKDAWSFYTPYIEEGYLYIECETTFGTSFTWKNDGFGTASINDTFSKKVPVELFVDSNTVTANTVQNLKIKISVNDLDVKKPTTLYVKLFALDQYSNDFDVNINFTISW